MRHFVVFHYPQEVRLAPSWAARVGRDRTDKKAALTEAVWFTIEAARKPKWKLWDDFLAARNRKRKC